MGLLSGWRSYFPPLTSRNLLAYYVPVSGAASHTLFTAHILSPHIVSRLFPVADLAVSNSVLFNAHLGVGFYVYFRPHLHKLNSWDRVEFAVFSSVLFNFGTLLAAVLVKALIPPKSPTWAKTLLAVALSTFAITRGLKYIHYVDARSKLIRSPSTTPSPRPKLSVNGGDSGFTSLNGHHANGRPSLNGVNGSLNGTNGSLNGTAH